MAAEGGRTELEGSRGGGVEKTPQESPASLTPPPSLLLLQAQPPPRSLGPTMTVPMMTAKHGLSQENPLLALFIGFSLRLRRMETHIQPLFFFFF